MRKLISIILLLIILLCSCADKQEFKTTIYPSDILTATELEPYVGYAPVMSEEKSRRVSTAVFTSDPPGTGETVIVKVYQKNQLQSEDAVKAYFDECKNARSDAFSIDSLGVEAFVAYPFIHYYTNGYHVQIGAGTGSDNLQKALLMNLAKLSYENLRKLTGINNTQE